MNATPVSHPCHIRMACYDDMTKVALKGNGTVKMNDAFTDQHCTDWSAFHVFLRLTGTGSVLFFSNTRQDTPDRSQTIPSHLLFLFLCFFYALYLHRLNFLDMLVILHYRLVAPGDTAIRRNGTGTWRTIFSCRVVAYRWERGQQVFRLPSEWQWKTRVFVPFAFSSLWIFCSLKELCLEMYWRARLHPPDFCNFFLFRRDIQRLQVFRHADRRTFT